MDWRLEVLAYIEQQLCILMVNDPEKEFENDIDPELNGLTFNTNTQTIELNGQPALEQNNTYLAPRVPKLGGSNMGRFNTPIRSFLSQPVKPEDVASIDSRKRRRKNQRNLNNGLPAMFLQIAGGTSDIRGPAFNESNETPGRIGQQIEYFEFNILGVFRDRTWDPTLPSECTDNPNHHWKGNGRAWFDARRRCQKLPPFPDLSGLQESNSMAVNYWRPVNQQALGFVHDVQLLLDLAHITAINPMIQNQMPTRSGDTFIMNTYWGDWIMLPNTQNSPVEVVSVPLILKVYHPKSYNDPSMIGSD